MSLFNRNEQIALRRRLRRTMTRGERILWNALRKRQLLGLRFRRQFGIGPYVVDFYCPELQLVIESDGPDHERPERIAHDLRRTAYLCSLGMTELRFDDEDVRDRCEDVIARIAEVAQTLPSWHRRNGRSQKGSN